MNETITAEQLYWRFLATFQNATEMFNNDPEEEAMAAAAAAESEEHRRREKSGRRKQRDGEGRIA